MLVENASTMFSICVLVALIARPLYIACHARKSKQDSVNAVSPVDCRLIIEAKKLPNGQNYLQNKLNPPQSRALPNHPRLPAVFGIENAFTSDDERYVRGFVSRASGLVNLKTGDWEGLVVMLRRAVQQSLGQSEQGSKIHLMSLVQALTMRMVLRVLFRMDEEEVLDIPDEYLIDLASAINNAWIRSKKADCHDDEDGTKVPRFEENQHLQSCLAAIFPHMTIGPGEHNPLNLILPGFETMWRVVLRAFIEIRYTTGLEHPEWKRMLVAFAEIPTKAQFIQQSPENGNVSAEMLITESLRLYPPTRRIHRAFSFHPSSPSPNEFEIHSANIEASHTAPQIWGPTALTLDPSRWTKDRLTNEQRNAFFPFGARPFVCPAQGVFGPRVIGLLVGVLFGEEGAEWLLDGGGDGVGGEGLRAGKRLSNGRDAYGGLVLVKRG